MIEVQPVSSLRLGGPWLLDLDAIRDLDRIFRSTLPRLEDERDAWVHAKLAATSADGLRDSVRVEQLFPRPTIVYELELGKNRILRASSFDELRSSPGLEEERPCSFQATITFHGRPFLLSLEGNRKHLAVDVPRHSAHALAFLADIREWSDRYGPSTVQRWWLKLRPIIWFLFITATILVVPDKEAAREPWRSQALEFAKNGVGQDQVPEALRTLLALQVHAPPPTQSPSLRGVVVWVAALIGCILLSICPSIVIGLGKGRASLRAWRTWMKLVTISVPLLVFTTVLWPIVVDWFAAVIG